MKNKKSVVLIVIIFVIVLGGATVLYNKFSKTIGQNENIAEQKNEKENTKKSVKAPDFTVLNQKENEVHFDDLKGKPIILNFWASWCGPCQSEMPDFEEAYEKYGNDITFMMINMTDGSRETIESAKACIEDAGYTFPVYYDTTYSAASVYGVTSLPTTYFIDKERNIIANGVGALSADSLQQGIELITSD